jgi:2-dehydropantoate 2-reductase
MKLKVIAVIGAGPVGRILAAHLCGCCNIEVILIDSWKEHIDRIETAGLHIYEHEELRAKPHVLLHSISELGRYDPDFVFICTKACDLAIVLSQLAEHTVRSKAVFISAQNGIDTEQAIAECVGRDRVLRAIITYGGVLTGPGEIRETFFNPPNYIGGLEKIAAASCKEAAEIVTAAGLKMEISSDVGEHVWKKAILNSCTMAIAAVTGMNIKEIVDFPPTNQLNELLLAESISTAAAYGYDFGPQFAEYVREFNKRAGPHRPSMLVDLEKGRKTENGFVVRRIAEYAERKGVPAPMHRALANLIDALEITGARKPSMVGG